MKIGILTYHSGTNYGGTLQCYALQSAIKSLGHQVEVIDYQPALTLFPVWCGWHFRTHGLKFVRQRILQLRHGKKLLSIFDDFRKDHIHLSNRISSLGEFREIAQRYDAIITGSDQIWNFKCCSAYFLDLDSSFRGRRISYATCCTQEEQPSEKIGEVGRLIRNYDAISVRDDFSQRAVENASGRSARVVCDPTMLMDSDWPVEGPASPSGDVLIYRLGPPPKGDFGGLIKRIKEKTGAQRSLAIVSATSNPLLCREADEVTFTCAPIEWAERIRNCRFLITDSFHAALFALRYQTPFLAYYEEKGRAPRLLDAAAKFGFENRLVSQCGFDESMLRECLRRPEPISDEIKGFINQSEEFLEFSLLAVEPKKHLQQL